MGTKTKAIVTMFGRRRICDVIAHGCVRQEYSKKQTVWIERAEDEYALMRQKPPFCILYRENWLKGTEIK